MNQYSAKAKGRLSERLVRKSLEKIKEEGIIEDYIWIGPLRTGKTAAIASKLDHQGVDMILVKGGMGLPLQVKTNLVGAEEHKQKHPDIPVVTTFGYLGRGAMIKELIQKTSHTAWTLEYYGYYLELSYLSGKRLF